MFWPAIKWRNYFWPDAKLTRRPLVYTHKQCIVFFTILLEGLINHPPPPPPKKNI